MAQWHAPFSADPRSLHHRPGRCHPRRAGCTLVQSPQQGSEQIRDPTIPNYPGSVEMAHRWQRVCHNLWRHLVWNSEIHDPLQNVILCEWFGNSVTGTHVRIRNAMVGSKYMYGTYKYQESRINKIKMGQRTARVHIFKGATRELLFFSEKELLNSLLLRKEKF